MESGNTITKVLRDDHKRIRGLISQVLASEERAPEMREGVIRELLMELEIHSKGEKKYFYPQLHACLGIEIGGDIDESWKDHDQIDELVRGFTKDELRG